MTFVLDLARPIEANGEKVASITLREPTVGDMIQAMEETDTGVAIKLLTLISGQDEAVIRGLTARDNAKAFVFLGKSMDAVTALRKVKANLDDAPATMTINLRAAIETSGKFCDRLELHEPTLGEIQKADHEEGIKRAVTLVSVVSGQIRAVIERVPMSEFAQASKYVMGFL